MGPAVAKNQSVVELPLNHPRFMLAKVVSNGQTRSVQTTMGVDDKAFDKWSHQLDSNKIHSNYLLLPTSKSFSTKGLCGSSGTLTLNYDDYPYLLTEEIYNRKGRKSHFDQVQLWYLLYALLSAKNDIAPYSPKVGDIRPLNIFLNQTGELKVANVFSWPNQSTNFQKALDGQIGYLAPEEVQMLATGHTLSDDHTQEELFTIGLTVLSTGIMTESSDLYNLKNNKFDFNTAHNRLNQWKTAPYSQVLRGTITNICDLDKSKRMTVNQITTWISKYRQPIIKRTNFVIDDAPLKVHTTIQSIMALVLPFKIGTAISQNIQTTQSVYRPVSVPFVPNGTTAVSSFVPNVTHTNITNVTGNLGNTTTKFTYQSPNEKNQQLGSTKQVKIQSTKDIKITDEKKQEEQK